MTNGTRVFLSCALGSIITWYDSLIFATATALVFSKLFFTGMGVFVPIVVFASGFLLRPVGSLFFGHFGDKIGRKNMLIYTLYLTGLSSVLIGLLPTYNDIGITATILLILCRAIQSIAFGGEWAASTTMLTEHNINSSNRGLIASVASSGWAPGMLLASAMFAIINSFGNEFFMSVGWRIPFLFSFMLMIVGVYIRSKISETPLFQLNKEKNNLQIWPVKSFAKEFWKKWILAVLAYQSSSLWAYAITVFGFSYVINHKMSTPAEITEMQLYILPILVLALIFWGWLGDKISRVKLFHINSVFAIVLGYPIFYWVSQGQILLPFLSFALVCAPQLASASGFFSEIYPSNVRQTGSGLTYMIASLLGAGLLTMLAQHIIYVTDDIMSVVPLFVGVSVVSLLASVALDKKQDLIDQR